MCWDYTGHSKHCVSGHRAHRSRHVLDTQAGMAWGGQPKHACFSSTDMYAYRGIHRLFAPENTTDYGEWVVKASPPVLQGWALLMGLLFQRKSPTFPKQLLLPEKRGRKNSSPGQAVKVFKTDCRFTPKIWRRIFFQQFRLLEKSEQN